MKKVITALGNPIVNEQLKKEDRIKILGSDIQYQDGILEFLDIKNDINYLLLSEKILGENKIEKLIDKIQEKNKEITIILFLEHKKQKLEEYLATRGIYHIFYNNEVEIKDILNIILPKDSSSQEEIKQELNYLKEIILNNNYNTIKMNKECRSESNIEEKEKIKEKKAEIITILGTGGVGKSIISINIAKSLLYAKEKVLVLDFDILNDSLHTMLGVNKYSPVIRKKLKENSLITNKIEIKDLVIKINKNLDLISGINLIFDEKYKISSKKIQFILDELKPYYDKIIIDTSSECFFDYTKNIARSSDLLLFLAEANLTEIKKSKNLINLYIDEWEIDPKRINVIFNKYTKKSIDDNVLNMLFSKFNIIGKIKFSEEYSEMINRNMRSLFHYKKMRKEYLNIINEIERKPRDLKHIVEKK